ncbi:MAG: exodeoxyribonuclease VII large subunit [Oscillospiraceae bacterium]|nr:exodeoxyribonuclease VII large subunit [Oscillospiraceae bacterium]
MSGVVSCTVGQLNRYLKELLDEDPRLRNLAVSGEISNYKRYPSGHHYFTLKDAEGTLRCVMFRREAAGLKFQPENGMQVIASGRIAVYPRDGAYQLYCSALTPQGAGDLHVAFEQLKEKLRKEGLFDPAHKKPLPRYPMRIALITSSAGAAVRDMLRILNARWPAAKVLLLPVRVQGAEAPPELCGALRYANAHALADLIIIGRGGGSIEDLWAFNDETLARTIYDSRIPVISAVGHEPDVTISDYVADLRAATPSNAAELAVPDVTELRQQLDSLQSRLEQETDHVLTRARSRWEKCVQSKAMQDPLEYVRVKRLLLSRDTQRLAGSMALTLHRYREHYTSLAASLDAMSPLKVLARGYSIVRTEKGAVLKRTSQVKEGESVSIRLHRGEVSCRVERILTDGKSGTTET